MKLAPDALLDCGLLQFGRFGDAPLCFHCGLLPSFPQLLQELAVLAAAQVSGVDRLLAAPDALALGTALALQTGVPLVYSRGTHDATVSDLVGAYDIGHPTLLLCCEINEESELLELARRAQTVGLEVKAALLLLGDGRHCLGHLPLVSLFSLPELVDQLVADGALPAGQAALVRRWLISRRQGAAAP